MLNSRFAGIPISSSTIDGPGVPQLMNRGEQTLRTVTGSGGRLHFGMVAGIKSERWPTSNRNPWPDCVGIRRLQPRRHAFADFAPAIAAAAFAGGRGIDHDALARQVIGERASLGGAAREGANGRG